MKRKFFILLTISFVLLNLTAAAFATTVKNKKAIVQTNALTAKLPVSDLVTRIDLQRLMNVALPQILNSKPQMLAGVNAKIDEIKAQTGIDLRQFEQIAVGLKYQQNASQTVDLQPVALVSGKYDANILLTAMKLAAKDKSREEKSGAKTIYIFTPREINPKLTLPTIAVPGLGVILDFNKILSGEVAVAALDNSTLAIGKLARVRETLEGKSRVGQDILALVNRDANAVGSFGGNVPANFLSKTFKLEDDDIGKNLDSIRQMFGSLIVADGNAVISLTAKTTNAKQAEDLESTVSGLQMFGKSILGGMKGDDKAIYARMAENAKITRNADEVNFNLQIPQSDIDVLLGRK